MKANKTKFDPKRFLAWCLYHFKDQLSLGVCDFHRDLVTALRHNRIAIAAPRGHAKSTYCSFYYPMYMALEHGPQNIVLLSATGALAEAWLSKIRNEFENNPTIKEWYGELEGKKWTNDELSLSNGSVFQAKGAEKQLRGFRPTLIVGDDLETDEMVISSDRRKKFDDWFWQTLVPALSNPTEDQIVVIGTILERESFLSNLINDGRHGWRTRFYQAIKSDGKPLWPKKFSLDGLSQIKKEMGEYAFNQEYMNEPIPESARTFQKSWFRYFEDPPKGCTYLVTVDPAIAQGHDSDKTAIVTCAVDFDENIYVVNVINKKMLPSETVDHLFEVVRMYEPAVVGIEEQGFQLMLSNEIKSIMKEKRMYFKTVPLKSRGRRKGLRIESLQPRFERGAIYLRHDQNELKDQLLRFPSPRAKDDIIDALAYQLDIIRPGDKDVVHINPDCFLANIESRRKGRGVGGVWGNHKLRS